jgi:hypothetical protein
VLSTLPLMVTIGEVSAQIGDQREDAKTARYDALFATPNVVTPSPQDNIFATAPGLEQQAPRARFTINGVAPLGFTSNAEALSSGGTSSSEFSPVLGASWSAPVFNLPLRFTGNVRAEVDRFMSASSADFDKLAASARLQYVDPDNDQAYSPFFTYAPRWDFAPFYRTRFATRQDLNLGVNKAFNFDADLQRIAVSADSSDETAWSFGLSATLQKRFRDPAPESWAASVAPSLSYVISPQWNVSAGVFVEYRDFDSLNGMDQEDWLVEPILTLEFVLPASWFGSETTAMNFGRPALDFQAAYEKNWSNVPAGEFEAWYVGVALKLGWSL